MKTFVDVFSSPVAMIDGLRDKPTFWPPIAAMFLLHIVVGALHFLLVDHNSYYTNVLSTQGSLMSKDEVEVILQSLERSGSKIIIISQLGPLFFYTFLVLVSAGYLALVTKIVGSNVSFRHWLSLVSWTSTIGTLSLLARAVAIIAAPDGRLGFLEANPLSLSNIVGREFQTLTVAQFDVTNAWRWALLCLAYKRWTSVSWILSIAIVLIPILFLYAIPGFVSF